jgi:ABC-2 type transport system permease protein
LNAIPTSTTSGTAPASSSVWQQIGAQTRAELLMTLRRGESVLVTIIMPVVFLIFFAQVMGHNPPAPFKHAIDFLLPGLLAVAIMSTGMVSLGIATAYERYYGVLKRLGTSPLPRWGLLAAKILAVLAVEVVQAVLLCALAALLFGWRPSGAALLAIPLGIVGTATFAGIGLLMAGALRAEATLAGANGLYVVFLAIGGVFLPLSTFPAPIASFLGVLPPGALSNVLRGALTSQGIPGGSVVALCLWAVVVIGVAARTFRWE